MSLNERIVNLLSKQEGLTRKQIGFILDDVPMEKIIPRLTILLEEKIISKTNEVHPRYSLYTEIY